jgi:hypothetical protein
MTSSNKFSQNIATLHCHVARMALLLCGPVQSSWKRRRGGRESSVSCRENAVGRTSDGAWAPVKDVCVDHGGADVRVAEEFLDYPDVVAVLQQVGGKGVAKRVAAHALGDARSKGGDPDGIAHAVEKPRLGCRGRADFTDGQHRRTRRPTQK